MNCIMMDKKEFDNKKFLSNIKEMVISNTGRSTIKQYQQMYSKAITSDESLESLADYSDIKHVLKYVLSKLSETLPKSLKELDVFDLQKKIFCGGVIEDFLILDTKNKNRILVFF